MWRLGLAATLIEDGRYDEAAHRLDEARSVIGRPRSSAHCTITIFWKPLFAYGAVTDRDAIACWRKR